MDIQQQIKTQLRNSLNRHDTLNKVLTNTTDDPATTETIKQFTANQQRIKNLFTHFLQYNANSTFQNSKITIIFPQGKKPFLSVQICNDDQFPTVNQNKRSKEKHHFKSEQQNRGPPHAHSFFFF